MRLRLVGQKATRANGAQFCVLWGPTASKSGFVRVAGEPGEQTEHPFGGFGARKLSNETGFGSPGGLESKREECPREGGFWKCALRPGPGFPHEMVV